MFKSKQLADYLLGKCCEEKLKVWEDYAADVSYDENQFPAPPWSTFRPGCLA